MARNNKGIEGVVKSCAINADNTISVKLVRKKEDYFINCWLYSGIKIAKGYRIKGTALFEEAGFNEYGCVELAKPIVLSRGEVVYSKK